mgnify:CR=1 FL=1
MHFDAKIFYRDDLSGPWIKSYESNFSRNYLCEEGADIPDYQCDPMHFVELGSVPHKYYLINYKLQIFSNEKQPINRRIGRIEHMNMPGKFSFPKTL